MQQKLFLWQDTSQCSDHYHSDGSVLVLAESEEAARALMSMDKNIEIPADEKPVFLGTMADTDYASDVFVFPNAGCC